MVPNAVSIPRTAVVDSVERQRSIGISIPLFFGAATALLVALFEWPQRWLFSGAAFLTLSILAGASNGYRVLPIIPLWTLIATLNLTYAIAATSWLLYILFAMACYPAIFLTFVFQFDFVANFMRQRLRGLLKQLQFVNDKIAFFDIPALEIDTDVDGLMVIRGISISLSSLTVVAHGVEVGIKLSDDMELAIQTETVTISLFRKIEIGDCYANIKGGEYEMTFRSMDDKSSNSSGDALMVEDTPLLKAAALNGDTSRPTLVKMTSKMTNGKLMKDSSAQSGLGAMTKLSPDDDNAIKEYHRTLDWISQTNLISQARKKIGKSVQDADSEKMDFDHTKASDMRAAICSQLHDKPSVPHPPRASIKVTTLQNLSPPWVRRFLHRLPMLLRLLLNPISYFHPVSIASITAAGSGKWITHMLRDKLFQNYVEENAELRRLEQRVSSWLSDANFAVQLADITGVAHVPFISAFDITAFIGISDVLAYRTPPQIIELKQVVRLGGADATFTIPSFLLPHHEHLLPPRPKAEEVEELIEEASEAEGKPKTVQMLYQVKQAVKDEANVKISAHARLPAVLDQELLNFIAALVKATKVVELEKEPSAMDRDFSGFRDFASSLNQGIKDGAKKVMVDGIVNDKLIAKLVGKVTKSLETLQGDVGYSGNIPVKLEIYRAAEGTPEAIKLLA